MNKGLEEGVEVAMGHETTSVGRQGGGGGGVGDENIEEVMFLCRSFICCFLVCMELLFYVAHDGSRNEKCRVNNLIKQNEPE